MLLMVLFLARADSGDTGEYVDTDATAELVYSQDEGCGGGEAAMALPIALLACIPRKRR